VRDQREPLVTSQLTPSQTAITEAALGRSFFRAALGTVALTTGAR